MIMNKRYTMLLLLLLLIGFATVTTVLTINGNISMIADQDAFSKNVIFIKAVPENGGNATIEDKGKKIKYVSKSLINIGETAQLDFEIANKTRQYDAKVTVNCEIDPNNDYKNYISIRFDMEDTEKDEDNKYLIPASTIKSGVLETTMIKSYVEEINKEIEVTCTLLADAVARDELANELDIPKTEEEIFQEKLETRSYLKTTDETNFLGTNLDKSKIEKIYTVDNIKIPENVSEEKKWDVSEAQNGSVMAWITDDDSNDKYELYIGSNLVVIANPDSSNLFSGFTDMTSIDLSNLNTSQVINMSNMFYNCSSLSNLDVSNFDTKQVTDMNYMFANCTSLTTLDLTNFYMMSDLTIKYIFSGDISLDAIYAKRPMWDSQVASNTINNMRSNAIGMFDNCKTDRVLFVSYIENNYVKGYLFFKGGSWNVVSGGFSTILDTKRARFRDSLLLDENKTYIFELNVPNDSNYYFGITEVFYKSNWLFDTGKGSGWLNRSYEISGVKEVVMSFKYSTSGASSYGIEITDEMVENIEKYLTIRVKED